jgi:predicted phosphodiesterase
MRIQVLSDIHFDVDDVRDDVRPHPGADCIVVAGDVGEGMENSFEWLRERFGPDKPIVAVAGNHTYYRRSLRDELKSANTAAKRFGVHFLEDSSVELGNVKFIGCTLWTDYRLLGDAFRSHAMKEAREKMYDHKKISLQKEPWKRFLPQDAAYMHSRSIQFLKNEITPSGSTKLFVVTHHAPSIKSIAPHFRNGLLSAAYASDLENMIVELQPGIWLHGHTHNSSDYFLGNCRVVCNPHGYGLENPSFEPTKLVEL